jgi:PAS domain S-box-containing protein
MGNPTLQVLLVEHESSDVARIQELLAGVDAAGFAVHSSKTLEAALKNSSIGDPDVVLLDISHPQSYDGQAFAVAHGRWPRSPIVVLSSQDDQMLALRAMQEGAQDYLVKGHFDTELLTRAIRHAIERKRAEQALTSSRNLLRNLIDNIPDQIYAKDRENRFIITNTATERFFGATADALIGKSDFDLLPADAAWAFVAEEHSLLCGERLAVVREAQVESGGGSLRWLLTTKVPLKNDDGAIIGIVGVNRDITERKQAVEQLRQANTDLAQREKDLMAALEDVRRSRDELHRTQLQLVQAEKMESIGRLAAGVAHEVKNPLAVLAMGVDYLQRSGMCATENGAKILSGMSHAVERADLVIRGLLDFSAPGQLNLAERDLPSLIEQTLTLVKHEIVLAHVTVRTELAKDLPRVRIDAPKIEQVFINLFVNAAHAMQRGGTLTVRAWPGSISEICSSNGHPNELPFDPNEPLVLVQVEDTGHGIAEEQFSRVFEPFFTTKQPGQGTGLGLTVTKTILELHGAAIRLQNRIGKGLIVTLVFRTAAPTVPIKS